MFSEGNCNDCINQGRGIWSEPEQKRFEWFPPLFHGIKIGESMG
jgi:hypothetical protein